MASGKTRDPEVGAAVLMVAGSVVAGWGLGSVFGNSTDGAIAGSGMAMVALGWLLVRR